MLKLTSALFLAASTVFSGTVLSASAEAQVCQVLDFPASKVALQLNTPFGQYQGKVIKASGYLLEEKTGRKTVISIPAGGVVLDEAGLPPLMLGLINTVVGKPVMFRSQRIEAEEAGSSSYNVEGVGLVAGRKFPASFPVTVVENAGQNTNVNATLKSDNINQTIGIDGTVEAIFKLAFRPSPPENCVG